MMSARPEDGGGCRYPVVVVGGGIAGVTAAKRLLELGVKPVLVLEGADRLGGRVRSEALCPSGRGPAPAIRVEAGANWIHGASGANPIFELCHRAGIQGESDAVSSRGAEGALGRHAQEGVAGPAASSGSSSEEEDSAEGVEVRDVISGIDLTVAWRAANQKFLRAQKRAERAAREAPRSDSSGVASLPAGDSLRETLAAAGWPAAREEEGGAASAEEAQISHLAEWWNVEYEYAASAEHVSVRHNLLEEFTADDFGDANFLVVDPRGFGEVLMAAIPCSVAGAAEEEEGDAAPAPSGVSRPASDGLHKFMPSDIHVKVNMVVDRIEVASTAPAGLLVRCRGEAHAQDEQGATTFLASRVILTASPAVVQEAITFVPKLSAAKQEALSQIAMATYSKSFLWWREQLLPDSTPWRHVLLADSRRDSSSHAGRDQYEVEARGANACPWRILSRVPVASGTLFLLTAVGAAGEAVERRACEGERRDLLADAFGAVCGALAKDWGDDGAPGAPDAFFVSGWSQRPLIRGAYSLLRPGCPGNVFAELQREELGGGLFLAGEACHERYSGYVHGAYASGRETAERVAAGL